MVEQTRHYDWCIRAPSVQEDDPRRAKGEPAKTKAKLVAAYIKSEADAMLMSRVPQLLEEIEKAKAANVTSVRTADQDVNDMLDEIMRLNRLVERRDTMLHSLMDTLPENGDTLTYAKEQVGRIMDVQTELDKEKESAIGQALAARTTHSAEFAAGGNLYRDDPLYLSEGEPTEEEKHMREAQCIMSDDEPVCECGKPHCKCPYPPTDGGNPIANVGIGEGKAYMLSCTCIYEDL